MDETTIKFIMDWKGLSHEQTLEYWGLREEGWGHDDA